MLCTLNLHSAISYISIKLEEKKTISRTFTDYLGRSNWDDPAILFPPLKGLCCLLGELRERLLNDRGIWATCLYNLIQCLYPISDIPCLSWNKLLLDVPYLMIKGLDMNTSELTVIFHSMVEFKLYQSPVSHESLFFNNTLWVSLIAQQVKNPSAVQETQGTWVRFLAWEYSLEKEMGTHSSILAWKTHGQRSLVGYSLKGSKESDMTDD